MRAARGIAATSAGIASWLVAAHASAQNIEVGLTVHPEVHGAAIAGADLRPKGGSWRPIVWDDLSKTRLDPGSYEVRVRASAGDDATSMQLPSCAGRRVAILDGRPLTVGNGVDGAAPLVTPLGPGDHEAVLQIEVSPYERRIACGEAPRVGAVSNTAEGLGLLAFESPHRRQGGGRAVVYIPPGHDLHRNGPLLVGLHPWNGTIWTYAAYEELLREARARDLLLLMPSGLGNSLYTADAEDEVVRAIDAMASVTAVDPQRVSIWGASMGGAGATTVGFHRPDRFASVTSFFGDSRYDRATYVRAILRDDEAAHAVNALDVVDNARNLPVWLIHGEDDATSPVRQSEMLASAMQEHGFAVRFDRVPGFGHAGALVARFLPDVVAAAATARANRTPSRVTYRSVNPAEAEAYGVRIEREKPIGDAFIDVERRGETLHVLRAEGVRTLVFAPHALGTDGIDVATLVVDAPASTTRVEWSRAAP
jgi:pimeloyl-ACP methyl ester carboxylesterase